MRFDNPEAVVWGLILAACILAALALAHWLADWLMGADRDD